MLSRFLLFEGWMVRISVRRLGRRHSAGRSLGIWWSTGSSIWCNLALVSCASSAGIIHTFAYSISIWFIGWNAHQSIWFMERIAHARLKGIDCYFDVAGSLSSPSISTRCTFITSNGLTLNIWRKLSFVLSWIDCRWWYHQCYYFDVVIPKCFTDSRSFA